MKTIWNILATFAFLNMVALLAFAGWLVQSGRLDKDRVVELRDVLAESPGARTERLEAERLAAQPVPEILPVDAKSAEDRLEARMSRSKADEERLQRLRREVDDLKGALARERRLLDEERTRLETRIAEFNAMREAIFELEGSAQFQKALVVLETVKADEAKSILESMLGAGNRDEVIAYLDAMEDRARAKVIAEFVGAQDAPLAAELLEDLRVRGLEPDPPGGLAP